MSLIGLNVHSLPSMMDMEALSVLITSETIYINAFSTNLASQRMLRRLSGLGVPRQRKGSFKKPKKKLSREWMELIWTDLAVVLSLRFL